MGELFGGRYELLDAIGDGGMGTVWRVRDHRTGEVLAAKVLRQSDAVSLLRFVRETAVRVCHPHVLAPIAWAGEDDKVLFTMPVVDGGSVRDLVVGAGPLPPLLVAELLRQLLEGLEAVHAAGIVHRDVKPANLLLAATGSARPHLYLGDFGIAVEEGAPRLTTTEVVVGTPGFIAPELERGAVPSVASDLYAAGMVAAVLLTGRRGDDRGEAATLLGGTPPALSRVVTALTAVDPQRRPASAAEARALLDDPALAWGEGGMAGLSVPVRLPPLPPTAGAAKASPVGASSGGSTGASATPPRPGRRRGWLVAASVLVLVGGLAAVGVGLAGMRGGQADPTSSGSPSTSSTTSSSSSPTSSSSSATSTSPTPTSSTGNYTVGTVVQRVGQRCSLAQEDERATTLEGSVPVTCRWDADEQAYAWQRD